MEGILIFIHTIICVLLAVIILMQSGRGGGLTEGFSSAENLLGAQTDSFLTRTTTIFSVIFFITCLTLAVISSKKDKSLMANRTVQQTVDFSQESAEQTPVDVAQELDDSVGSQIPDELPQAK